MCKCTCGASKWKTRLNENYIQCLRCYKKYTLAQARKLAKSK